MVTQSKQHSSLLLERVFNAVLKRNFSQAEDILISFVEHIFDQSKHNKIKTQDIHLIQTLYSNFNHEYLTWVEQQNLDTMKEIDDLMSPEHDNFLIAQCNDPASVDDLMFELVNYVTDKHVEEQEEEVEYHLTCYKRVLTA